MTRSEIDFGSRWIGAILFFCGAFAARAQEPPGEMSPRILNPSAQMAHYGFYPTQWKTFPGSWSEVRPLIVAPAPVVEPTPVKRELEVGVPKTKFILPDESAPPITIDRTAPAAPAPPLASERLKFASARISGLPTASPGELPANKSVVYVGSSLDARNSQSGEPVWLKAAGSRASEEPKAWLGLPAPANNFSASQPIASDSSDPWRSVSSPKN